MEQSPFVKGLKPLRGTKLRGPCFGLGPVTKEFGYQMAYIGRQGALDAIYDDCSAGDWVTLPFDHIVESIAVYKDQMYILASKPSYTVFVRGLGWKSEIFFSWRHCDSSCDGYNKLIINSDRLIIPDRSKKQLTVYSFKGIILKQVSCPGYGIWKSVALCNADNQSIVVSSTSTSTIFKINIDTEVVTWICTSINLPGGVTCYNGDFMFVSRWNTTKTEIYILCAKTGKRLGRLIDPMPRAMSSVPDLAMFGDKLIVLRMDAEEVIAYELKKKEGC
ncbi:uncharacterized protein [Watersipora subatra]|uniref:uncharacterized protein n=1 Tax=Watersipora subatra TaxID=2589382 RepID=UPI00355BC60E